MLHKLKSSSIVPFHHVVCAIVLFYHTLIFEMGMFILCHCMLEAFNFLFVSYCPHS